MTTFIAHVHAEIRRALLTRRGATHHPDDVPVGLHKTYSRMPFVQLPEPAHMAVTLADALEKRASAPHEVPLAPISLAEYGTLFGLSLRKHEKDLRRRYPSGGALYPVETYLVTALHENDHPMIYHYNPTKHGLEELWPLPASIDLQDLAPRSEWLHYSGILIFTSVWKRSSAKYGDLAYSHALLEAGHMSENILLVATALGLPARPIAGFRDDFVTDMLDLNPDEEQPIHSIVLAKEARPDLS